MHCPSRHPPLSSFLRCVLRLVLGLLVLSCGAACSNRQTAELERLRRISRENWTPVQPAANAEGSAGAQGPAGNVEHCTTCHQFANLSTPPSRADFIAALAPQQRAAAAAAEAADADSAVPAASDGNVSHPGSWLSWHDPQRFGCVSCHNGTADGLSLASSGHRAALQVEAALARGGDKAAAAAVAPARLLRQIRGAPEVYASCGSCHPGSYVPAAAQLTRGRQLIRELGCSACHQLSAQLQTSLPPGRTSRGPSLARVGEKLSLAQLESWPNTVHDRAPSPGSAMMPQYRLSENDARAIALYLKGSLSSYGEEPDPLLGVPRGPGPPPFLQPDDPLRGLALVRQARCINCHSLPVSDLPADDELRLLPSTNIGPSLERIGERLPSEWIEQYLAGPAAHYPGTRMPQYRLTTQQRRDIAAWLVTASSDQIPRTRSEALPDWFRQLDAAGREQLRTAGRRLFVEQGCAGCHAVAETNLAARQIGPSLLGIGSKNAETLPPAAFQGLQEGRLSGLFDYFAALLEDPQTYGASGVGQGRMPQFRLDAPEREAIATALLAESGPPVAPQYQHDLSIRELVMPSHQTSAELFADPLHSDYWPWPIPAQGLAAPAAGLDSARDWLSLAERGLQPENCGACHRQQYRQWQGSRHARAMAPGVTGQLLDWLGGREGELYDCLRCHARLSEQLLLRRVETSGGTGARSVGQWEHNPHFLPGLQSSAHGCANCHLRSQVRAAALQSRADYLWDSKTVLRHALQREDWLRDSRLCADCHQFDTGQRVSSGGPPLENTYEEWRAWAADQAKPRTCQDCHMPEGDHSFKGIHDADFVRESATVRADCSFDQGQVRASLTLVNSNNGHHLPTYVTPRIWLQGFFTDSAGKRIDSSFRDSMVGRDARSRRNADGQTEWFDSSDTRIPADGSFTFDYRGEIPAGASSFSLEIFVEPDHFYYHAYGRWLKQPQRSAASRALLEQARQETAPFTSGYYLFQRSYAVY